MVKPWGALGAGLVRTAVDSGLLAIFSAKRKRFIKGHRVKRSIWTKFSDFACVSMHEIGTGNLFASYFCLAMLIANHSIFRLGALPEFWSVIAIATIAIITFCTPNTQAFGAAIKELPITALPLMWLAGVPWRRNLRDFLSLSGAALAAGFPFILYYVANASVADNLIYRRPMDLHPTANSRQPAHICL